MLYLYDLREMALNRQYISISALCIYLVAICALCFMNTSSLPDTALDLWGLPIDKVVHFLMFAPFPILAFFAYNNPKHKILREFLSIIVIFTIGCSIAIGTEYIQKYTGYRSFEVQDMVSDIIGLFVGSIITATYTTLKHYIQNDK